MNNRESQYILVEMDPLPELEEFKRNGPEMIRFAPGKYQETGNKRKSMLAFYQFLFTATVLIFLVLAMERYLHK